jgi:hypothetical protein
MGRALGHAQFRSLDFGQIRKVEQLRVRTDQSRIAEMRRP